MTGLYALGLVSVEKAEKGFSGDHIAGLQVELGEEFFSETPLNQRLEFDGTERAKDGLILDVDDNAIGALKKVMILLCPQLLFE